MDLQGTNVWKIFPSTSIVYGNIFRLSTGGRENIMNNLLKRNVIELAAKKGITVNKLEQEVEGTVEEEKKKKVEARLHRRR